MLNNEKSSQVVGIFCGSMLCLTSMSCSQDPSAEDREVALLADDAPYHLVSEELFDELVWDLHDGGAGLPTVSMTLPVYDSSIGGRAVSNQRYSPEFTDAQIFGGE